MSILRREASHTDDHSDLLEFDWRSALQELKQDVKAVGKAVKESKLGQASNAISCDLNVLACKMRELDDDGLRVENGYIIMEVRKWANQLKKVAKSIGVMMLNWANANDSEQKRKKVNKTICIHAYNPKYGNLRY